VETGHLLALDKVEDFLKKKPLGASISSPLKYLNPAYHSEDDIASARAPMSKIRNTKYFDSYEGISIRKHSNYYPSFRHTHGFMEICYVMSGHCTHQFYSNPLQKEPVDVITMHENDLLLIPPGMYHTINSLTDSVILNILVKPAAIEKTIAQFLTDDVPLFGYFARILYSKRHNSFLLFHLGKNEFLDNLLDRLLLEYCNRQPLYPHIMNQILGLYFSIIQRNYGNDIEVSSTVPAGTDYIPKFLLYLQSHYVHFSMEEMAAHFHLTASYISRIFKINTGNTIINTVMGIRLETAKNILKNSNHTVDDIAEYIGYQDTTYFIRIFHKKFSLTPQQYRKRTLKDSSL
jgi:AraC-like DNA-binding protein/cupin superfamily acireductone dioxygenase involved in methionine salvage